jgi:hypothetical protein
MVSIERKLQRMHESQKTEGLQGSNFLYNNSSIQLRAETVVKILNPAAFSSLRHSVAIKAPTVT